MTARDLLLVTAAALVAVAAGSAAGLWAGCLICAAAFALLWVLFDDDGEG